MEKALFWMQDFARGFGALAVGLMLLGFLFVWIGQAKGAWTRKRLLPNGRLALALLGLLFLAGRAGAQSLNLPLAGYRAGPMLQAALRNRMMLADLPPGTPTADQNVAPAPASPLDLPTSDIVQPVPMGEITNLPAIGGTAIDVTAFARISHSLELAYPNNYNIEGCIERELHDGQFLAGGCKDGLYALRLRADGKFVKAAHLGLALMANAQHGNPSLQVKAGLNLGTVGQIMAKTVSVIAPKFEDVGATLPPWTQKLGNVVEFDFAGGPRLWHDSSVNGNWAYGVMATLNLPIETCFKFLTGGL